MNTLDADTRLRAARGVRRGPTREAEREAIARHVAKCERCCVPCATYRPDSLLALARAAAAETAATRPLSARGRRAGPAARTG